MNQHHNIMVDLPRQQQQQRPVLGTITNNSVLSKQQECKTNKKSVEQNRDLKINQTEPGIAATVSLDDEDYGGEGGQYSDEYDDDAEYYNDAVDTESEFERVRLFRTCGSLHNYNDNIEYQDDDDVRVWTLNDFHWVNTLGKGGAATVYAAQEVESKHLVALKIQPIEGDDDDDDDALCEIDLHESVSSHDCIVNFYDYFFTTERFGPAEDPAELLLREDAKSEDLNKHHQQQSKKYLVMIMELANGGSLYDLIRDSDMGYLSEPQAAFYFWDAVDAMDYVHSQDIIHCDVKTLNFLVHNESCLQADFGMSVQADSRIIVGGSPMFMAPEHLQAWRYMTSDFDHRTDTYSLGVMLYEMLVGCLPYEVLQNEDGDDGANRDTRALKSVYTSMCAAIDNIDLEGNEEKDDEADAFRPPILDLRKLFDISSHAPRIKVPTPVFPEYISAEAKDLISRLMEPDHELRISLEAVKNHAWFQKHCIYQTS